MFILNKMKKRPPPSTSLPKDGGINNNSKSTFFARLGPPAVTRLVINGGEVLSMTILKSDLRSGAMRLGDFANTMSVKAQFFNLMCELVCRTHLHYQQSMPGHGNGFFSVFTHVETLFFETPDDFGELVPAGYRIFFANIGDTHFSTIFSKMVIETSVCVEAMTAEQLESSVPIKIKIDAPVVQQQQGDSSENDGANAKRKRPAATFVTFEQWMKVFISPGASVLNTYLKKVEIFTGSTIDALSKLSSAHQQYASSSSDDDDDDDDESSRPPSRTVPHKKQLARFFEKETAMIRGSMGQVFGNRQIKCLQLVLGDPDSQEDGGPLGLCNIFDALNDFVRAIGSLPRLHPFQKTPEGYFRDAKFSISSVGYPDLFPAWTISPIKDPFALKNNTVLCPDIENCFLADPIASLFELAPEFKSKAKQFLESETAKAAEKTRTEQDHGRALAYVQNLQGRRAINPHLALIEKKTQLQKMPQTIEQALLRFFPMEAVLKKLSTVERDITALTLLRIRVESDLERLAKDFELHTVEFAVERAKIQKSAGLMYERVALDPAAKDMPSEMFTKMASFYALNQGDVLSDILPVRSMFNTSIFGAYVAQFMQGMDRVMLQVGMHNVAMILMLMRDCVYDTSINNILIHVLLAGGNSTGKSFLIDQIIEMSIQGTFNMANMFTSASLETNSCMLDHVIGSKETSMDMFLDKRLVNTFKSIMTDNVVETMDINRYYNEDTGNLERKSVKSTNVAKVAVCLVTNDPITLGPAMESRFHIEHAATVNLGRFGMEHKSNATLAEEDRVLKQKFVRAQHWMQFLTFHVFKMIDCGVLPNISTRIFDVFMSQITEEYSKVGVAIKKRCADRIMRAVRCLTVKNAIVTLFLVETGPFYGKPFEFHQLLSVTPLLYATYEICIFALTLFSSEFDSENELLVKKTLAHVMTKLLRDTGRIAEGQVTITEDLFATQTQMRHGGSSSGRAKGGGGGGNKPAASAGAEQVPRNYSYIFLPYAGEQLYTMIAGMIKQEHGICLSTKNIQTIMHSIAEHEYTNVPEQERLYHEEDGVNVATGPREIIPGEKIMPQRAMYITDDGVCVFYKVFEDAGESRILSVIRKTQHHKTSTAVVVTGISKPSTPDVFETITVEPNPARKAVAFNSGFIPKNLRWILGADANTASSSEISTVQTRDQTEQSMLDHWKNMGLPLQPSKKSMVSYSDAQLRAGFLHVTFDRLDEEGIPAAVYPNALIGARQKQVAAFERSVEHGLASNVDVDMDVEMEMGMNDNDGEEEEDNNGEEPERTIEMRQTVIDLDSIPDSGDELDKCDDTITFTLPRRPVQLPGVDEHGAGPSSLRPLDSILGNNNNNRSLSSYTSGFFY